MGKTTCGFDGWYTFLEHSIHQLNSPKFLNVCSWRDRDGVRK